jgi:quercetin dioxygenase-like cupin family protein
MSSATTSQQAAIDLPTAAAAILSQARAAKAGRAGRTLTPGAGAPLKQALLALTEGSVLADHESPGDATLHVLTGRVRLTASGTDTLLSQGAFLPIPPVRHGIEALEDAVLLLTVAQGARVPE